MRSLKAIKAYFQQCLNFMWFSMCIMIPFPEMFLKDEAPISLAMVHMATD